MLGSHLIHVCSEGISQNLAKGILSTELYLQF